MAVIASLVHIACEQVAGGVEEPILKVFKGAFDLFKVLVSSINVQPVVKYSPL